MNFTLDPALRHHFSLSRNAFDQIMLLRGQVFRELEGRRTQRIELDGQGYFLKQHFGVGYKEIIKNLLQLRLPVVSAENEWLALHKLYELKIPTMRAVGFGSRGWNPATRQSFLLTEELVDMVSLEDLCLAWQTSTPSVKFKRALIKEVARMARVLHENGVNHRDFYICHFLIASNKIESEQPVLYLIDLHRAQIRKTTPLRWVIKDLAGLYFSSKDCRLTSRDLLRFIREYRNKPLKSVVAKESNFWERVKRRGDKTYQK